MRAIGDMLMNEKNVKVGKRKAGFTPPSQQLPNSPTH